MTGILTPRLGLYKADPEDYANVETDVNDNFDILDSAVPPIVCTSGTRPSTPYEGMLIYENDTNRLLIRTSTNKWRTITPRDLGAATTSVTDLVLPTTAPVAGTAIASYTLIRRNNVPADGVTKFTLSLSWSPFFASADPTGTDGFVMYIMRCTAGGTTYGACTLLGSTYLGKEGGRSGAPSGAGSLALDFTPPVGTWDYVVLCWRTDGSKTFTFAAGTSYPHRLKLEENVGAEY